MSELIGKWNYYFLRYAAGAIIGALLIVFLAKSVGYSETINSLLKKTEDGKIELGAAIAVISALGLAFCYIASAPGAVFHATRGIFFNRTTSARWRIIIVSLVIPAVFCFVVKKRLIHFPALAYTNLTLDQSKIIYAAAIVSVFIFAWQLVLLGFAFADFKPVKEFYWELTDNRAQKANNIEHYRRSYRDLREHGNAFEIVILELLLVSILIVVGKEYAPLVLALWVLPAAFCWIIGTMLEFRYPAAKP